MNIVPPYVSCEIEVMKECNLDKHDKVERDGYRPPSEKVDDFIKTGNILALSRYTDGDAELPSEESEFEPDSEEYREELTKDAEEFDEAPLAQYVDKISAQEILDEADKKIEASEKLSKKRKKVSQSPEAKIVDAIQKGFNQLNNTEGAEHVAK